MQLDTRSQVRLIPSYSLTADVLSFARCGLQYRFHRVGSLPASRPVQMWFGQFMHGVLEEAYRRYQDSGRIADREEREKINALVEERLRARGLFARNRKLEETAQHRAHVVVEDFAPLLFPFISQAEVRLTASRPLANQGDIYQMTGVVDVISSVDLQRANPVPNPLLAALQHEVGASEDPFEVIIDYKGMPRPRAGSLNSFDEIYDWQVLTYAELRQRQVGAEPVMAAALVYLNELAPTWKDVENIAQAIAAGVEAAPIDSSDAATLATPRSDRGDWPLLSLDYRVKRAVKVIKVKEEAIANAVDRFDQLAIKIEESKAKEKRQGKILSAWVNYSQDPATCAACDWRQSCPKPAK